MRFPAAGVRWEPGSANQEGPLRTANQEPGKEFTGAKTLSQTKRYQILDTVQRETEMQMFTVSVKEIQERELESGKSCSGDGGRSLQAYRTWFQCAGEFDLSPLVLGGPSG